MNCLMFLRQRLTCFGKNHPSRFFIIIFQKVLLSLEFFKPDLRFLSQLFVPPCRQTSRFQSDVIIRVRALIKAS